MKVLTITDVRKNIATVIDSVIDDAEECVVPRGGGKAVVIVSLDEWNAMRETLHLLSTRTNARRLFDALDRLDAGDGIQRDLIDDTAEPGGQAA